jgi:hypothetical protein
MNTEIVAHPAVDPSKEGLQAAVARVRCGDCASRVELDVVGALPAFRVTHDDTCPTWRTRFAQAQAAERARAKRERKKKTKRKAAHKARRSTR